MNSDTIGTLIRAQATLADRTWIVIDRGRLTYGDAERRSGAVASALLQAGAGRGTHVAMLFGNSTEFAVGFLAITRIGAIAIPFSTLSTAHELHGLLLNSDAEYLLCAESYRGRDLRRLVGEAIAGPMIGLLKSVSLPTLRRVWFGLTKLEEMSGCSDHAVLLAAEAEVVPADPLAMIHTSGSTSAPKGVIHTHGQIIRNMRRQNVLRDYTQEDRLFSNSPWFWIGGLAFSLIATLIAGGRLICSSAEPAAMLDLLEAERPTMTNGVAATVLSLARDPSFRGRDLSSLRRGNLYPIMPADVRPVDPELRYNLLGMTESGSVYLLGRTEADLPEHKRGAFGSPVEGVETRLVDPDTGKDGLGGEMWLRGPNVMQGYYGRERWECFDADGWFHTGDMMTVDADGDYYFKGRAGDIIRTAGAQVSPREVEAAISEVTGGRMSIVIGIPDAERGQIVTAVLVGDMSFEADQIKAALRQKLSPYKIPRRFVALADKALPTLSSGKLDLKKLVEVVRAL
jgi:acyl-CoA synthetase (AMP-forming)/AMP-acid ligase II